MSLPNFREFTINDVRQCLENNGYLTKASEYKFAWDNDYFKYIGVADGKARYLVGFESDQDESMYVSVVFVMIGNSGTLVADYSAMPVFESENEDEIAAYIENRCN